MIIVSITGGLGNQMFMYAAGLATAHRLKTELLLDTWICERYFKTRPYSLGCFPAIKERHASLSDIWKLYPCKAIANYLRQRKIYRYLGRSIIFKAMNVMGFLAEGIGSVGSNNSLLEPIHFSRVFRNETNYNDFCNIPDDVYMIGYWEHEKFFENISSIIRKKFCFAPECFDNRLASKICACNSVALHVRRGDKVQVKGFDYSREDYIKHSVGKMVELVNKPEFFVFSDDILWCKKELPKIYDTNWHFIEGQSASQDMALMTICKHIITAPSTFSWWSAWLNNNHGKVIIAPKENLERKNYGNWRNLTDSEWIIID